MIEKTVYDFLVSKGLRVYMEDPAGTPSLPYYLIQKTGGGITEHIGHAVIAIQSYGSTLYQTALANETLKTAMEELTTVASVTSCDLNSDYQYNDIARKAYRYQAVFDIYHY